MDQQFINVAVRLAVANVAAGGKPFGAVIVAGGTIIATGINEAEQTGDPTAHAEMQAIRQAAQNGKGALLKGALMYANGHPCPMCLAAMHLAHFAEIYFDATLEEVEGTALDVKPVYRQLQIPFSSQSIPLVQLKTTLTEQPVQQWLQQQGRPS